MSKILVVEHDQKFQNLCRDLFSKEGHKVIFTPSAEKALSLLASEEPDLILLDIQIPGEEGMEYLKKMTEDLKRRKCVIVLSQKVTPELEKSAMALGAIEVLSKEASPNDLRDRVHRILAVKHRVLSQKPEDFRGKILIVDDEEDLRLVLTDFFSQKGFEIVTAEDGEEAVRVFQREKPNVVLMDVRMPRMDGIEALKKIKEIAPNVGVVMATAMKDEKTTRESIKFGAYAYVIKPYDLSYLELVVLTRLVIAS
jgi:DNA-binding response OmpR family regulator